MRSLPMALCLAALPSAAMAQDAPVVVMDESWVAAPESEEKAEDPDLDFGVDFDFGEKPQVDCTQPPDELEQFTHAAQCHNGRALADLCAGPVAEMTFDDANACRNWQDRQMAEARDRSRSTTTRTTSYATTQTRTVERDDPNERYRLRETTTRNADGSVSRTRQSCTTTATGTSCSYRSGTASSEEGLRGAESALDDLLDD